MKIDVHAHIHPESSFEVVPPRPQGKNQPDAISDLPTRIRHMDERRIDMQLLSVPPFITSQGVEAARALNRGIAEAVQAYPERFRGLATVQMEEPEAAAAELERAVKDLGFVGVEIMSNASGENLNERRFTPFYRKVQELDVPVFIHPHNVVGHGDRLSEFFLSNLIGNPTDTAIAAASLIFGGILKEFPRLKFVLAHGGGTCPYLIGRWDRGWSLELEGPRVIEEPPSTYFKMLYFDALVHNQTALEFLLNKAGADHVLLGSDYPFGMGDPDQVPHIEALDIPADDKELIFGGNAQRLFKLG
ncbi:MAG: amidohydrolase family protein [Dehalococcoidia bacterium]